MAFETNFNGTKSTVTDFQRIFTFKTTGLKPNTYYDAICESKLSNHCATQKPTATNTYSKTVKRIRNVDSTGVDLAAAGLLQNGLYKSASELPLRSDSSGKLDFEFDGSAWIQDGGVGSTTTDTQFKSGSLTVETKDFLIDVYEMGIGEAYVPGFSSVSTSQLSGRQVKYSDIKPKGNPRFLRWAYKGTSVGWSILGANQPLNGIDMILDFNTTSRFDIDTGGFVDKSLTGNVTGGPFKGATVTGGKVVSISFRSSPITSMNVVLRESSYVEPVIIPEPEPVQPTPVQPTPVQPGPVQPTPVQPTPVVPPPPPPPPPPLDYEFEPNVVASPATLSTRVKVISGPEPAPMPLSPIIPSVPVGWDVQPPEIPANTVTQRTVSNTTVTTSRELGVLRTRKEFGTGGQVPLSEVSLYFDYAQTFFLDPAQLEGTQFVTITGVNLYFKNKPHKKNNQSGILNPGVYLFICEAENDKPNLRKALRESIVRVDYDQIEGSLNASNFTEFSFKSPMPLKTGKSYAIVINFEDPQYSLWTATQGVKLTNSERLCDNAYNFGKLYRASNYLEIDNDPKTQDEVLKPLPFTDLKFDILGLEFTQRTTEIELINDDYEFLEISNPYSRLYNTFINIYDAFGKIQHIYQDFGNSAANVFYHKPGTISVGTPSGGTFRGFAVEDKFKYIPGFSPSFPLRFPSSLFVTGVGTSFNELSIGTKIVITDGVSSDANGYIANTNIRTVNKVVNNTLLIIDAPCTFTCTSGRYKVTPVGEMNHAFQNPDTLILTKSNANQDVFFVSNAINYITFTGGTGYTNTDYIQFSGAGAKRNGRATITTNSTGGIVSINIVNTGYGFTSSPVVTVYDRNNAISTGSGATFNVTIGGQIKSELWGGKADIVKVTNFPINNFIPNLDFNIKGGSITNSLISFSFLDNITNAYNFNTEFSKIISGQSTDITTYEGVVMSKSLEVLNRSTLGRSASEGKSSVIRFTLNASNKYDSPEIHEELASIYAFTNEINNDATNEHTNFGNAKARHISKKITFDKDRFAEDIRVIVTAYRPEGTDIKIYAKVHNSKDEDAFDDKAWSELEIVDVTVDGKLFSSRSNKKDYIELTYGFKNYPDYTSTITGDAFVYSAAGNTTVTGVGTSFDTELANGDVIVLYSEDFPNTTYGVALVANTPTSTAFEINKAFSNVSLEAATLKIAKTDKPYMVFNDIHNDNVATYYSTSLNEFTTYDTFAVKVVMLSNSSYIVPRLNDIRAIGVSA